jgi:uncharacterized protein YbjQ (UPF0145 family)
MTTELAEEFTQGLGQIGGGFYKIVASAVKLGVPKALGMATDEWVQTRLGGYMQMSIEDRREAVKELLDEGFSQREAAAIIGVTEATVNRDKKTVTNVTEEPKPVAAEQAKPEPDVTNVTPEPESDFLDVEVADEEPEPQPEPEPVELQPATPGWHQLGPHWLFCGDSTDPEFIKRCAGATFAFADPPYNAGKADWDNDFVWNHDYLAEQAGIVAVTPGVAALADFLTKTGMPYKWTISAEITNGMTRGALGFGNWVAIPLFTNGSLYRNSKDVLRIPASTGDDKGGIHPSRKPIRIVTELLGLFTNKDDMVVDPFLGSGTTLIAADRLGRRCVGAELDPMYCAHIIARYEQSR